MENYEQKYKEALEIARKINSGEGVAALKGWSILEVVFPELKKSEDELIREELIHFLETCQDTRFVGNRKRDKWIKWLEKQGQKPTWSEEDEDSVDTAIRIIQNGGDDCAGILDSDKALKWLQSLKQRLNGYE